MNDKETDVYKQAHECYQYQDQLKWSRFKTLSVVEGALLVAVGKGEFDQAELRTFMVFASLLVLILCILSARDRVDARVYLSRIKEYEQNEGFKFPVPTWAKLVTGWHLMVCAMVLINVFNLILLLNKWRSA